MTEFGIVPEGFRAKTLRECLSDIESDQLINISRALDVSPTSPDGQRNAIESRAQGLVWELFNAVYDMLDPDKAEGAALIALCKLTGTIPQPATFSSVLVSVDVEAGTVLSTDQVFLNVNGKPDVRFTPAVSYTAATAGTFSVLFRSEFAGPVQCVASTLIQVSAGPSVGTLNSVINPLDATLGQSADDETRLRLRRASELAAAGSSSVPALETDLRQAKNLAGDPLVSYVKVFENSTSDVDADGRTRNSIEILAFPGSTNVTGELAAFIFSAKGAGPTAFGFDSDTFTDTTGEVRVIKYTVPTDVLIYVTFNISTGAGFAGATAFKAQAALLLNAGAAPGASSAHIWDAELAARQVGVTNLVSVTQGLSASPVGATDIPIGSRARAAYDTSRIVVNIV